MASGTSLESPPITVGRNSTNSFSCRPNLSLKLSNEENKNKTVKNNSNRKYSASYSYRRPFQRQQSECYQNSFSKSSFCKRRYTFSSSQEYRPPFKRRRRGNTFVLPTKFLLGGNINDPLNLQSLADEEVNKLLNKETPKSSPVPTPKHRTQVQVLIPTNINDPLNLNTGEEIEFNSIKSRKRRRSRHRKKSEKLEGSKTEDEEEITNIDDLSAILDLNSEERKIQKVDSPLKIDIEESKLIQTSTPVSEGKIGNKIVSPVVPQGSPSKFYRKFHTKSISKDNTEADKQSTVNKPHQKKRSKKNNRGPQCIEDLRFREKDYKFRFGNCNVYFGRSNQEIEDHRLRCLRKEWFEDKSVLDIGCNAGHVTLSIAKNFIPRKIIGIDIDDNLIKEANRNVSRYLTSELSRNQDFPISLGMCYGPLAMLAMPCDGNSRKFPNNVEFIQGNYVLEIDDHLETQQPEFDTILCLNLTKWIHLNFGDDGLKRAFRRIYKQLKPGGRLILEAQPWPSYADKKKLTETTYRNYYNIRLRPEQFNEYLLSKEVGFTTCEFIGRASHPVKGFRRQLYLFTKITSPAQYMETQCEPESLITAPPKLTKENDCIISSNTCEKED